METMRKISIFFTFVFITHYKLKMGKLSEKSIIFCFHAILEGVWFSQIKTHTRPPLFIQEKNLLTKAIRDFPRDVKQLNESIHILLDKKLHSWWFHTKVKVNNHFKDMISVNIVIHFPYIHRSVIPAIRVKLYLLTKTTILTLPLSLSLSL